MARYGIPYQGSKSKIAEDILDKLPRGKRLVDLFGGGFAITHCAIEKYSDKWDKFLYNDINPLLQPLIQKAISGYYNYNVFKPKWISREEFFELKEKDGYIKYIWSFGNNGNNYLFGRNIEESKRKVHDFVVFGKESDLTEGIKLNETGIHERRLEWMERVRKLYQLQQLEQLEQLQRLQQLERLQRLQRLERLELKNISYDKYEYQDGDVVYCDIPYESSKGVDKDYGGGFNHDAFYEWAERQPFDVYVSNYLKYPVIWQKEVRSVMKSGSGGVKRVECVYKI